MKTLTTIESNVLNNANVRNGLNIEAIETATINGSKKSKSGVNATFETAKLISNAVDYFKSKECKQIFVANGLMWNLEDFFNHIGYDKSWSYKLIKAVKLGDAKFKEYTDTDQKTYSIEAFIKYASETPTKEKEEFKLKLTFGESKLSINDKDELTSTLTKAQIQAVIILLKRKMDTMVEA
jgi:hypothetical protein